MKMIELTQYKTNDPILVNLEKVSSIAPNGSGTWIRFSIGDNWVMKESYDEVLKRIAEVNDKQFCFVRRPEKPETSTYSEKAFHEQKIVSAEAIYTGGGIWNYMGELESGKFFMAFDDDYYGVLILDADPRKAGEDGEEAYYPYWQEAHTLWEYNEGNETEETLGMIRRLYNFLKTKDFIDKESHITALDNHEYRLRMEGKL
jgi:uncharacterized protein YlzI (FlbEa/FlbD family)